MPRYRVNEAHFLDNKYIEAGSIVDWSGPPSRHMTPIEEVAKERKARYDGERPHLRASRDLPPRAAVVRTVMVREPGMPRPAGPPGQEPAPSADPANIERTVELVDERREFREQDAKLQEEALTQPDAEGVGKGKAEAAARERAAAKREQEDDAAADEAAGVKHGARDTRPKPSK